jgi:signal transduction histidine kinase
MPTLKTKDIAFRLEIDSNKVVKCYPGLLFQIFTNLIMNSFIHGFSNKDQGAVNIIYSEKNGTSRFVYSDNGKGIKDEAIPKIFDPFYTTKKSTCSGIGLSIISNIIVNKLNGKIEYRKEKSGATFVIDYPVIKDKQ